ncbi:hypothetical protein FQA39_LY16769 [Lamprigera yunnana]|nr:hypothetical protein FQA39_LY16769 [Lamprigera yunnana]
MCPKHLGICGGQLVGSLIDFFQKERDAGRPFIPLTSVRDNRVAVALYVNIATISRISQSLKKHEVVQPVAKCRVQLKPITNVENFCQDTIQKFDLQNVRELHEELLQCIEDTSGDEYLPESEDDDYPSESEAESDSDTHDVDQSLGNLPGLPVNISRAPTNVQVNFQ